MTEALKLIADLKAKRDQWNVLIERLEAVFLIHEFLENEGIEFDKKGSVSVQASRFDPFHPEKSIFDIQINGEFVTQIPFKKLPKLYLSDSMIKAIKQANFDRRRR